MRYHYPIVLALVVSSCSDGKKEAAEAMAAQATAAPVITVDLSAQDMPLFVELGDASTLGVDSPTVLWNEEMGRVEVSAGEHFGITIREDAADLARVKADLDRDMLQKHALLEEGAGKLVYRSQFPDEDLVFIHFYQVLEAEGRTFIVQDDPNGRFNEADITRMSNAVKAQKPV